MSDINTYIFDQIGIMPTKIEDITRFKVRNRIFKISSKDGSYLMKVFLNKDKYARLKSEICAADLLAKTGLVQKITKTDESEKQFSGPVLFRSFVEGIELKNAIRSCTDDKKNYLPLIKQALDSLKIIHSLEDVVFKSDQKNLFYNLFGETDESLARYYGNFEAVQLYLIKKRAITSNKKTLCNGDIGGHEFIIRPNGKISIIDWETLCYADPARDFGYLAYSLAATHYRNFEEGQKIIDFVKAAAKLKNIDFYIAERAIGTSLVYYQHHNLKKLDWAMEFSKEILKDL